MAKPPEVAAPAHTAQMAVWTALGGGNSGIKGNKAHVYGFHRGAAYVDPDDYSRRRDPNGSDGPFAGNWGFCCAGDYRHGGKPILRARHAVLLTRLMDRDPELADVCEFIGQPYADGPVLYWAVWENPRKPRKYTGAGHDLWSHVSVWRSKADKVPPLWLPASATIKPPPKPAPPAPAGKAPVKAPTSRPATLVAPAWPKVAGRPRAAFRPIAEPKYNATVRAWQARMKQRGWAIKVDGYYGEDSAVVARAFQREKRLDVDGLLGPATFAAAWTAKVTG